MSNQSSQNNSKNKVSVVQFLLCIYLAFFVYANAYAAGSFVKHGDLTMVQKQARAYRAQGLEQQSIGNLNDAMSLYQKAIELDPGYAVGYNDLGIIYEAKGMIDRAEDSYQAAITVDPNYLSAYSNLALLYETKNELEKAASYWKKRGDLGLPKDPWTLKAKERFAALMKMSPSYKKRMIEQAIADLDAKVSEQKKFKKQEDLKKAKEHLSIAKKFYNEAEYEKATEEIKIVLSLNPQEKEASNLASMVKAKIAEREKKIREEKKKQNIKNMQSYFETGVRYYQQDNLQAAKEEFAKIREFAVSPQKK